MVYENIKLENEGVKVLGWGDWYIIMYIMVSY